MQVEYKPFWPWTRKAYEAGLRRARDLAYLHSWTRGKGLGQELNSKDIARAIHREIERGRL